MQVSTKLFNQQSVNQFGKLTSEIQDLQAKVSTGKSILKSSDDPVAAAKVAREYSDENEKLKIIGGSMGSEILDANGVDTVSKMP